MAFGVDAGLEPSLLCRPMAFEFRLPDIGEGVVEGEIVKWLVKAGETIEVDQPMVEVMTDKATVVIPSPRRGVVKETRGQEGEVVEVDAVLVVIEEDGESASSGESAAPVAAAAPGVASGPGPGRPEPSEVPQRAPVSSPSSPGSAGADPKGGVLAAPATRRLARELGVELSTLRGTGPAGRVTADDVRRAHEGSPVPQPPSAPRASPGATAPAVSPAEAAGDERIPVRGLRKRIWENMAQSAFTAAHFTFVEECDATDLVALRGRLNQRLASGEAKLSYLPFILKAILAALKRFPTLNGQLDEPEMTFVQRSEYHLGIAVSSDRGLIVPVIRHADRRSLLDLASEIQRLSTAVRDGTVSQSDLGGSTFTVTSLGKDGGIFATPIINYPEVAIMGVHKIQKRPMVVDDRIAIRDMMNFSLSFDHRWIDGHVGSAFTYAVIRLLENPDRLMMEMA